MIQLSRRVTQLLVVLLILLIPFLGIQGGNLIQQPAVPKGSTWSITILNYNITDPLAVLGSIFASREVYIPLLLTTIIPLILTILLGKVFCGWLCPMNFILELNDKVRNLLKKSGNSPHNMAFKRRNKYYVLGGGLFLTAILGVQVFPLIYPPAIISREVFYLTVFHTFGKGIYLILFVLIFELAISRRWWCRYICPGGALLSLIGLRRLLVIRGNNEECKECSKCIQVCPLGLNPIQDGTGIECDNCGICISKCPQEILHYGIRFK